MLQIVLDTDVMVAALQSDAGASRALLLAVLRREVLVVMSTSLIIEYEAVLTRPAVLSVAGVEAGDIAGLLDELANICVPVAIDYRWRPVARDPDDDHVLETAINGGADMIATFNLRDLQTEAALFGIAAARPSEVLKRVRTGFEPRRFDA